MPNAVDREHHARGGGDVVLGQLRHEPQRLLLGEPLGRRTRRDTSPRRRSSLAAIRPSGRPTAIGRPATGAPYWYRATHVGRDRLAPVIDRLLEVEGQVDRLELIRLDLELAGELALARLVEPDPVGADGRRLIERQTFAERAELRERDRARDDLPPPAVGDLEPIVARRARWRTGRPCTSRTTPRSATTWPGRYAGRSVEM